MPARAALLSLVLAGPGLAAPPASPLSPESDNAAILAAIDAADPAYATTPAPVEQVVAAAELAEARLAAAEGDAAAELLMLAGAARRIAARRAPADARHHLCAMLADAALVLGRLGLSAETALATSAAELKAEAIGGLSGAECPSDPPPPPPIVVKTEGPAPATGPGVPPPRSVARLAVGGTLAGLAAALTAGAVAGLVGRRNAREEVDAINAAYMADNRPPTEAEVADGADANDRYKRLGSLALGLGLAAGASLAAGLGVLLARPRAPSRARLRATGAGFVYAF